MARSDVCGRAGVRTGVNRMGLERARVASQPASLGEVNLNRVARVVAWRGGDGRRRQFSVEMSMNDCTKLLFRYIKVCVRESGAIGNTRTPANSPACGDSCGCERNLMLRTF